MRSLAVLSWSETHGGRFEIVFISDRLHYLLTLIHFLGIESNNLASPLVILKFLTSADPKKCHKLGTVKVRPIRLVGDGALIVGFVGMTSQINCQSSFGFLSSIVKLMLFSR